MVKACPAGVLTLILAAATQVNAQENIKVNVVKYDGLKEVVLRHRGKVVVVDFWADYCVPCKKNMPHLVELAQKYNGKGLAVVTVSIDDIKNDPAVKGKLEKFLERVKAHSLTNLLLDEPPPVFEQKLHFKSVPTVFVFDRRGQWVQFTDEVDPHEIDKLVTTLMNE
jgi:thiol-disulfide isomerase/thioredoxin